MGSGTESKRFGSATLGYRYALPLGYSMIWDNWPKMEENKAYVETKCKQISVSQFKT